MLGDLYLLFSLLIMLMVANGAPIVARKLLPSVGACALDGGHRFFDKRPIFGSAKTVRGIVSACICTAAISPLLGFAVFTGITIACGAMLGDLISSFIKRRLAIPSSGQALVLDQVPESLIPLLFVQAQFNLEIVEIFMVIAAFFLIGLIISRILFKLGIRHKPY